MTAYALAQSKQPATVPLALDQLSDVHMFVNTETSLLRICMEARALNGLHIKLELLPSSNQLSELIRLLGPVPDYTIQSVPEHYYDAVLDIVMG